MIIQYISRFDNSKMLAQFANVFRENGFEFIFTHIEGNDIIKDYKRINPNIVFVHHNRGILNSDTWNRMGCYKIWWTNDDRYPPDNWRVVFAPIFNLFIVASIHSVKAMQKLGTEAEYLIMGYNPRPYAELERDIDVSFLGQNSGNIFTYSQLRHDICRQLEKDVSGFKLCGRGWGENYEHTGKGIYHRSKIGLSISHEYFKYAYSNRILDIMGHGAMCLCYRTSSLDQIFKENETIVFFDNYQECLEKINYYLENDSERERIALAGRNYVEQNLTWKHKAMPIINMIEKRFGL